MAKVSTAALESFFSTVFSCDMILDKLGEVLKDHFLDIQTKFIPRSEYSDWSLNNALWTSVFFEILFSMVSVSKGSAAAKTMPSISFSIEEDETKQATVYLRPDQVSLAIGKGGHNIKLASKLAGYEIDVYREGAEDIDDVDLDEFTDEIDDWILNELKNIGCDSAKSVLDISKEDLVKRTDLEEETVDEIMKILSSEFE